MAELKTARYDLPFYEGADPADGAAQQRALAERVDAVLGPVPIGALLMWMTTAAPEFWLLCDGTSYAVSAYPQLGAVLGENPAGSGNFRVPDLLGRFPLGIGPTHPLRQTGGVEAVALATAQLPVHNHAVSDPGHAHSATQTGASDRWLGHAHSYVAAHGQNAGVRGSPNGYAGNSANESVAFTNHVHNGYGGATGGEAAPDHLHGPPGIYPAATGLTVGNSGGGATHENMPPFLAVNFIIRAG